MDLGKWLVYRAAQEKDIILTLTTKFLVIGRIKKIIFLKVITPLLHIKNHLQKKKFLEL